MNLITTRFAPSPTGYLHIGHAASALFAAEQGQKFILRIEDIDATRCKPEFIQSIYDDLEWLGLSWEKPVRVQSHHFADYQKTLHKLDEMGLIYPCFCTRKDILSSVSAPHGPEGPIYPRTCRALSPSECHDKIAAGEPYALRLDMAKALEFIYNKELIWHDRAKGRQIATPEILGDVVLARKDTPASYHLCVTHDDALQEITLVTRGKDLFYATHLHRLLQEIMGYPAPEYHHHPLITDAEGKKFSKRDKAVTLKSIREAGFSPEQLRGMIDSQHFAPLMSINDN